MKVSKRFVDRARPALRKYQKILECGRIQLRTTIPTLAADDRAHAEPCLSEPSS